MDTPLLGDEYFMRKAIQMAELAFDEEEVPIGAVIVHGTDIIGKGYNQTERLKDSTAHAEMLAITAASNYVQSKYLSECTMYVTVQPCVMCAGAIVSSRLMKVVYGAFEPKTGCSKFLPSSFLSKQIEWEGGVLEDECKGLMQEFFKSKR